MTLEADQANQLPPTTSSEIEEDECSTQTTSALKNSSSATASGSANPTDDQTAPEFNPNDICSPHELIGWVDDVLEKLESKFSRIETDVIERYSLELSMSGLLDGATQPNTRTPNNQMQPQYRVPKSPDK
ncbi:hypothetical protein H4Q26_012961 [Puccinia striiformis f. sp. tritici PST-130]|nr:hypothetical protein H4Q26_012961 [Puccinia striiformis f. sp. tritici PST-130]